jgi:arginase
MVDAAWAPLPWPEAALVEAGTLEEQIETQARASPARPLVLGGCCCAHVGTARALARRGRLGVVWLDAHGDLNTPESSPSGDPWGMALRMLIDAGDVAPKDVTLIGARSLDPPEQEFIEAAGIRTELGALPERIYVAIDCDVLEPGELDVRFPEPGGPTLSELEHILASLPRPAGAGFSGLRPGEGNAAALTRLARALGL